MFGHTATEFGDTKHPHKSPKTFKTKGKIKILMGILSILVIVIIVLSIKDGCGEVIFPWMLGSYLFWAIVSLAIGGIAYEAREPISCITVKTTSEYTIDMEVSRDELNKAKEIAKFGGKYVFQLDKEHYEKMPTINAIIWPLSVDETDKEVWRVVPIKESVK